jgi:hypothetical protein
MSDNWLHIFPADPRQAKPDWPRLRGQLLDRGFIQRALGRATDREMLHEILKAVLEAGRVSAPSNLREVSKPSDVIAAIRAAGLELNIPPIDYHTLPIPQFVDMLMDKEALPRGFDPAANEIYRPGPLFDTMCDVPNALYRWPEPTIYFRDFGDKIMILAGSLQPPGIPGTDRVFEEWVEFIEPWSYDPSLQWVDPESGKAYGLLDLDWEHTFGAGKCCLTVFSPGYLNGEKAAALVSELTGQPYRYALVHL